MTENHTIEEAAAALGISTEYLLAFDQTLTGSETITAHELADLRHIIENTDSSGVYHAPAKATR